MRTPKPKTVKVECDVCGQDWTKHKPDAKGIVRLDECVRLLKAALAAKPVYQWPIPGTAATPSFYNITAQPNI